MGVEVEGEVWTRKGKTVVCWKTREGSRSWSIASGQLVSYFRNFLMVGTKRESNSTHGDAVGKEERGEVCFCAQTMEEAPDTRRVELQEDNSRGEGRCARLR